MPWLAGSVSRRSFFAQVYPARSQPAARLAWAAIGTSAGAVLALAGVALALVYLLLKRPAEKAVSAPVAAAPSN